MKKNLKKYLSLVFLFIVGASYSQDTIVTRYIPIAHFKEAGYEITQKDSTDFQFHNGDTLVKVPEDYKPPSDKNSVKVAYEPKDSTFLELYKSVVYNTDKPSEKESFMRYWKEPVKIYFEPSVSVSHANELMQFALKISKDIDSLNIKRVYNLDDSNYRIYYLNSKNNTDFEPRISGKSGYYVHWNGKNQIYQAALKINTSLIQNEPYKMELLKFHFFRSLGYFKSSKKLFCKSYLSACSTSRQLTDIDLELLEYHYSYGVCKGVNLKDFEKLHANFRELKKKHKNVELEVIHSK